MPIYDSSKRTQDALDEALGKGKYKKAAAPKKKKKKLSDTGKSMDQLRREAIERAKAAR